MTEQQYEPVLWRCPNDDFPIRDVARGCPRCSGQQTEEVATLRWLYAESQWLLERERALKAQVLDINEIAINTLHGLLAIANKKLDRLKSGDTAPFEVGGLVHAWDPATEDWCHPNGGTCLDPTCPGNKPTNGNSRAYLVLRKDFGQWLLLASSTEDALKQFNHDLPSENGEHRGIYQQVARPTETPEDEEDPL